MNEAVEGIRAVFVKRPADFFALRRGTAGQSHQKCPPRYAPLTIWICHVEPDLLTAARRHSRS
jgi:hypothetical protein